MRLSDSSTGLWCDSFHSAIEHRSAQVDQSAIQIENRFEKFQRLISGLASHVNDVSSSRRRGGGFISNLPNRFVRHCNHNDGKERSSTDNLVRAKADFQTLFQ